MMINQADRGSDRSSSENGQHLDLLTYVPRCFRLQIPSIPHKSQDSFIQTGIIMDLLQLRNSLNHVLLLAEFMQAHKVLILAKS